MNEKAYPREIIWVWESGRLKISKFQIARLSYTVRHWVKSWSRMFNYSHVKHVSCDSWLVTKTSVYLYVYVIKKPHTQGRRVFRQLLVLFSLSIFFIYCERNLVLVHSASPPPHHLLCRRKISLCLLRRFMRRLLSW